MPYRVSSYSSQTQGLSQACPAVKAWVLSGHKLFLLMSPFLWSKQGVVVRWLGYWAVDAISWQLCFRRIGASELDRFDLRKLSAKKSLRATLGEITRTVYFGAFLAFTKNGVLLRFFVFFFQHAYIRGIKIDMDLFEKGAKRIQEGDCVQSS